MPKRFSTLITLGALTWCATASADTWTVHPTDVSADFATIADAVDFAADGDTL